MIRMVIHFIDHWISYRSLDQLDIIKTAGDHWVSKRSLVQLDIIGPAIKH